MKTKKYRSTHNETKKKRPNKQDLNIYCQKYANTFNQFEEDYEKKINVSLQQHHDNIEKELIKLFKTPFTPTKYRAQDDYYTYINYQWLSDTSKKIKRELKHYVQIDSFRVTQEKVYYELIDIVKDYIKQNKSHKARAIKSVYESMYNLDDKSAQDYIKYYVELTDKRIASNNIYEIFGQVNKNEIISWGCPLVWNVLREIGRAHV
jgi:hypothetical protein